MYIFVDFKGLVENGLISTRGQVGPLQLLAIRSTTLHRSKRGGSPQEVDQSAGYVGVLGTCTNRKPDPREREFLRQTFRWREKESLGRPVTRVSMARSRRFAAI